MKNIVAVTFILLSLVFSSCTDAPKKGNLFVDGKFTNCKDDTLYFVDVSQSTMKILDSAIATDEGSFEFHVNIPYEGFFNIDVGKNTHQFATIIAGPGDTVHL